MRAVFLFPFQEGGWKVSKLLFDEQPIVIDKMLAKIIGLNESIIIQQIHYWLKINEAKNQNYKDGRFWTYNSISQWHEIFEFWSYDTVKRTFNQLEKDGLIIAGVYNKEKRDRTKWYSINYELLERVKDNYDFAQCISAKCTNAKGQSAPTITRDFYRLE